MSIATAQTHFFKVNCEAVLTIIQIVQSHFAQVGQKFEHYPSRTCHTAVEHYRGGQPVPRAPSYPDGGLK